MKSVFIALAVLAVAAAQVSALSIRPSVVRPQTRPAIGQQVEEESQLVARPCVVVDESELAVEQEQEPIINVGTIIRPKPVQGGASVLLPTNRPLKPSDLLKPAQPQGDSTFLTRPAPVEEEQQVIITEGGSVFLVPVGRPLRPAQGDSTFLTRPAQGDSTFLTRPAQGDSTFLTRPSQGGASVLLPTNRPLKPSDLLKPAQPQGESTFLTRPAQVEEEQQVIITEGGSVFLVPVGRPLRPAQGDSTFLTRPAQGDSTFLTRPAQGDSTFLTRPAQGDSTFLTRPSQGGASVLLPTNRPLKPSDLLKPAQPGQEVEEEEQVIEVEDGQGGSFLLPVGHPLRPSDLLRPTQGDSTFLTRPAQGDSTFLTRPTQGDSTFLTRPAPVEEEATSNINVGTIIKPKPVQGGASVLLPTNRPLKPSDLLKPAKPSQEAEEEEQVIEVEDGQGGTFLLPVGRPLRPSDLLRPTQGDSTFLTRPTQGDSTFLTRPAPVEEEEATSNNINVGTIIKPKPVQGGGASVLLPTNRPLKPSDLLKPSPDQQQEESEVVFGGSGSSVGTKPAILLPNNRPQRPSILLPSQPAGIPSRPGLDIIW